MAGVIVLGSIGERAAIHASSTPSNFAANFANTEGRNTAFVARGGVIVPLAW
jgi:hypothetical protein